MMKMYRACFLLFFPLALIAQNPASDPDWSSLITQPNANFYQLSELHRQAWMNREIVPSCGWKPFKRWEWLMSSRLHEDGTPITGSEVVATWRELMDYNQSRSLSGNWHQLGPILDDVTTRDEIGGVGRTSIIAFHPENENIVLAGTPAGGLWKSMDGGNSWTTNTDWLPTLGVSCIAFDPENPGVVYIGTGDRDAGDAPGMGVMKSTDDGDNWEFVNDGIENLTVGAIQILPGLGVILIGTNDGIFRSTDGGDSWTYVSNNSVDYKDLEVHPTNPNIVYSTGSGKFYRSEDAGLNWDWIQQGINSGSRMVLAVTPANPDVVYVCSSTTYEFKAFYKSTDSGQTFTEMSDEPNILGWSASGSSDGGQAWYDFCIAADPADENIVYVGGIRVKKSEDSGVTWQDINPNYLHVDQHELVMSPWNGDLYAANDGGLYRYVDNSEWLDISNGLVNGQIYKIGQSPLNPNNTLNGFQDNGTSEFNGAQWNRRGGGDGFECVYDNHDESWRYGSIYYGSLFRTSPDFVNQKFCGFEVNEITEEGAWSTPYLLSPWDDNTMFVGLKNVWRSINIKDAEVDSIHWKQISNNLGGNNLGNINVLELCMADSDIMYVSEPNLKLFITRNVNADSVIWQSLSGNLPIYNAPITCIETNPSDTNIVYIGFHFNVFKSIDQGQTWESLTETFPEININSIVLDTTGASESLYIGTDMGVYYKNGAMTDWLPFSNGMPTSARVTELEIYYGATPLENRLKASTYGRGLWESDLYGNADITFPPVALLTQVEPSIEVYDSFQVDLAFYRALDDIPMSDLTVDDIYVLNGTVDQIAGGPEQFTLEITPTAFGEVKIYVADSVALDPELIPNFHSDTLSVFYIAAPEPFGYVGPGGVGDIETLTLWLRGDEELFDSQGNALTNDSTKVAQWRDISGHNYIASQSNNSNRPFLRTGENGIHGRNAVYFDGESSHLVASDVVPGRSISGYMVVEADSIQFNDHGWFASARMPNGYLMHPWKESSQYSAEVMDLDEQYVGSPVYYIGDASAAHVYGFIYHQDDLHQVFTTVFDDSVWPFEGVDIGDRDNVTPIEIRFGWDYEERFGHGKIAEHFVFSERLMRSHHTIVSNYLASKYGIDLGPMSRYHHPSQPLEVTGIGRETPFDFHNDAQGRGIVRLTAQTSMEDGAYLLIGEDGEDLSMTSDLYPILTERVQRTWGYSVTGNPGEVKITIAMDELPAVPGLGIIVYEADEFLPGPGYSFYPLDVNGSNYETLLSFAGSGVFTVGTEPLVSVPDYAFVEVLLFPNPAQETVSIQLSHAGGVSWTFNLYDALGKKVNSSSHTGPLATVNVASLSPGIYTSEIVIEKDQRFYVRLLKR